MRSSKTQMFSEMETGDGIIMTTKIMSKKTEVFEIKSLKNTN